MTDTVSIDTLKMAQADLDLRHVHLVHLGHEGFTVAHTDEERASGKPLETCDLHEWLNDQDGPPKRPGLYVATPHEADAYSEAYPVPRWDFHDLTDFAALNQAVRPPGEAPAAGETGAEHGRLHP